MVECTHLDEFLTKVTAKLSRNLIETYREGRDNPDLSSIDILSKLKSVMEKDLEEDVDEVAQPVDP